MCECPLMSTPMSAIAALCALSCASAPLAASESAQIEVEMPTQIAQMPMEVKPSVPQMSMAMEESEPDPVTRQAPPQITEMLQEMKSVGAFKSPIPPRLAQIPTVEPQPVDLDGDLDNADILQIQEVDLDGEFTYSDVQIQDRTGEQQQFSLETTTDEPKKDPSVLEVISDRQEYNERTNIVTAVGNVLVRFNDGVLSSDRLQINLKSKLAIANGNVTLRRGQQILRGEQFNYFFVQNRGSIQQAQGEVDQSTFAQDLSTERASTFGNPNDPALLLNERLLLNQPLTDVSGSRGIDLTIGSTRDANDVSSEVDTINRIRFSADEVDFVGDRWEAKNVYLTNDPFSPPELRIFAETATYQPVDETVSELVTTKTRLLIDDNISIPFFPRTFRFGESDNKGGLFSFGFDNDERGGVFIQRQFTLFRSPQGEWTITPQYLVQKALFPESALGGNQGKDEGGELIAPDVLAVTSRFNYDFNPRSSIRARGSLTTFDFAKLEDRLKVNLIAEQRLGNLANPFRLSQEFNYRDRLFNGSLGFQDVQRSLGVVLRSPLYQLGNGFSLDYQASVQNINANTDRPELLPPNVGIDLINLTRAQGTVALNYGLPLWVGKALPPTRLEGLRFTRQPIVPYVSLFSGLRGVAGVYSSGDRQMTVNGVIGLQGQFGHFSRNFLDYTGFNLSYSRGNRGTTSPFLFDRFADTETIGFGITQQIYGPFRVGFQTSVNLDRNEAISTDYFLEYSRRTHGLLLRYNPVLELGSLNLTINNFNWQGTTDPFVNQEIRSVVDGVVP